MITITTIDENNAKLKIEKGTPSITILLGIEMLIETLIKDNHGLTIDYLLEEIKRIYERDNKKEK